MTFEQTTCITKLYDLRTDHMLYKPLQPLNSSFLNVKSEITLGKDKKKLVKNVKHHAVKKYNKV